MHDLTRKGRQLTREEKQQIAFEEMKCRLIRLPVLHMPNNIGRIHLYSDTSEFATGSALYRY